MLKVRKPVMDELDEIMRIYGIAQDFMIKTGNPNQWKHAHPTRELIINDIQNGINRVICDESGIHGVFAFCEGIDPTYPYIEGGEWINDAPYVTIHRIAGDQKVHGIFDCAVDYCRQFVDSIRMDTHEDNKIMQKLAESQGFSRRGVIYLANGSPRIAYQWVK